MIALGALNPIDSARAELQNQIGNFLQGRARLNRLMNNQSLQIKGQAQGLYAVQTALETRLQDEITPKIQKINAGVYDASDSLAIIWFTRDIINQINDVGKLEKQAGVSYQPSGFDFDMSTLAIGGIMLIGIGLMSGVLFGRRQSA